MVVLILYNLDHYESSRKQLSIASVQSDIPDNDEKIQIGRGQRKKLLSQRYTPYYMAGRNRNQQSIQPSYEAAYQQSQLFNEDSPDCYGQIQQSQSEIVVNVGKSTHKHVSLEFM